MKKTLQSEGQWHQNASFYRYRIVFFINIDQLLVHTDDALYILMGWV